MFSRDESTNTLRLKWPTLERFRISVQVQTTPDAMKTVGYGPKQLEGGIDRQFIFKYFLVVNE